MTDWNFIAELEGRSHVGYWPRGFQAAGVTVCSGVDLAYLSADELAELSQPLQAKLKPYIGIKGEKAQLLLNGKPLILTNEEADELEANKRHDVERRVTLQYFNDTGTVWKTLPSAVQTVLVSLTWHYGNPWDRCPKFWGAACRKDWQAVINELRNFGDEFPTRRRKEAAYLETRLSLKDQRK